MISIRRDFTWLSIGLSFLAIVFSQGIDITLGRTTFLNFFDFPTVSIIFCVLASVLLGFNGGYYIYSIPLAFLSYVISPGFIAVLIFAIALTAVREIPPFARDILLGIDAFGLTYVMLAMISIRINPLILPIAVIEAGTPELIPLILVAGVVYGILRRESVDQVMKVPLFLSVFVSLLVSVLPLTLVNQFGRPETVDWIYYANWISSPNLGWFFLSRPLYLILLYPFGKLMASSIVSQWQIPVLSLIYVFSAYRLGNSIKDGLGPLASLLAGVSPTVLTFLYSGLQANFFSLSMMFLSLSYLLKENTWRAVIFSYLSLFSHVYAWAQLEGGIVIFSLFLYVIKGGIPSSLRRYVIFTFPPLIMGIILMGLGIFPVPLGFSVGNYLNQITILSWGTVNAFLYLIVAVYGLNRTPGLIYGIFASSILATFFLGVVQNLIIDIPLFIPATLGITKMNPRLRVPILLTLVVWALIMSLNSFPYTYNGVTI